MLQWESFGGTEASDFILNTHSGSCRDQMMKGLAGGGGVGVESRDPEGNPAVFRQQMTGAWTGLMNVKANGASLEEEPAGLTEMHAGKE